MEAEHAVTEESAGDLRTLDRLLASYRQASVTEREKGTYFERLIEAYFRHDPVQAEEYKEIWTFRDWAKQQGWDGRDTGIDLVAKLRNSDGFAAIQCKFYGPDHRIQKADIDSFISASGKDPFRRRVVVDTTACDWSANAEDMIRNQSIPVVRIGLSDLRESRIDWTIFEARGEIALKDKKQMHPHQRDALEAIRKGLAEHDRGKMIMACGTGKTFASLKIAEDLVGPGGRVLFMVPSLALMSQTVREWTNDADTSIRAFAVCSDSQVGKRRKSKEDVAEIEAHDLAFPATTNPASLTENAAPDAPDRMTVIFCTYQSIGVISAAQKAGLPDFNLIICDEAHRTTGAKFESEEDSHFVKIHDNAHVRGDKRLYMTATPRIFGEGAQRKASEAAVELCSMDDEELYGPMLFERGFSWAVENGLLTDYKVIVLAMDEAVVSGSIQNRLAEDNELKLDDATKIIGCYKALAKQGIREDLSHDPQPMQRGIAFCKDIKSSKLITEEFGAVVEEFRDHTDTDDERGLQCELRHVDGTFNAKTRTELLTWLSDAQDADSCRILSNARCLSEGVDVPALDAILFLHPRKSQIDVVQSVGRVMRRAAGKKLGYVILPVGIPAGMSPEEALNDNESYRVVWQILTALRSHDDRFEATINKMDLGTDVSSQIEVVAVTDNLPQEKPDREGPGLGKGAADDPYDPATTKPARPADQIQFIFDEMPAAIRARIVQKCGRRDYWEDWAKDIAKIAQAHITRIRSIIGSGEAERAVFDEFLEEIRDDLNEGVTEDEAIEMLAQHLITKPVFDVLFESYDFAKENPVSQAMQTVLDVLEPKRLDKEAVSLEGFYASVRRRASGIDNDEGKQRIIVELYDKFFRTAFPRMTQRLGIVYTPVEIVDFINHSVNEILQDEFGQTLGSKGVHIIDPFAGTGTFITRLLQSGLIKPDELAQKYRHEIHANEIILLAYYIAAVNIEAAYHSVAGGDYTPFEGICLTDTFQMYESEDLVARIMPDNSERRKRQKEADIRVIVGNPPYSTGQGSANDNAANQSYPGLDARIEETYAAASSATLQRNLYDSYIRAVRWGSDRLGDEGGVMAYVSNAGWIEGNAMDGLRRCLTEEFSNLYILHLRGNQRTQGETSRKEGGKIFGSGSRAPISINIFVKNPAAVECGQVHFHDIGDYLSREEKLSIVRNFGSIQGIARKAGWELIKPDENNDWLNQGDRSFNLFMALGDKKRAEAESMFVNYSTGVSTSRDFWCLNYSKRALEEHVSSLITFYNSEVERYEHTERPVDVNKFINANPRHISWSRALKKRLEKCKKIDTDEDQIVQSIYRPFSKQWLYFSRILNEVVSQVPRIFPDASVENKVICVTGIGAGADFSALIVDTIPNFHTLDTGQCFPLKLYEVSEQCDDGLFASQEGKYQVRDGITKEALERFRSAYPGETFTKEDLFYYIYGLLHSPDYRERFKNNLSKQLPRIPAVKRFEDFRAFADAGRKLADLHVNYESVEPYPVTIAEGDLRLANIEDPESFYRVKKMRVGGKRGSEDWTTVRYNEHITMTNIPLEAWDYVVNGKPALKWVIERQQVSEDKSSGIINDPNRYAIETVGNPAYPLELFQRVITVSLETMKIVRGLPNLEIDEPEHGSARRQDDTKIASNKRS